MNVFYPKLEIPEQIFSLVREITKEPNTFVNIPPNWWCIIIYHPATDQYYSTKSKDPVAYESIIRNKTPSRWPNVSLTLRKLFDTDSTFQFFVFHELSRPTVEQWLASIGKRRVATRMGEAAEMLHVMFEITSNVNRVKRYVVAPAAETKENLIIKANTGMAEWLKSNSSNMRNERATMRVATRSRAQVNNRVFEPESTVVATKYLDGYTHNQFRARTRELNEAAIKQFIRSTMGGV